MKVLLALHIVAAVFAVGPLVAVTHTASRGLRHGNAVITAEAARLARIYANVSVLVVILGFALMSTKEHGKQVAQFSDTWIWLSLLLWVAAMGVTQAVVAPTLDKAAAKIGSGEPAGALTVRTAVAGSTVGVLFVVIVFLMVYRPGS